MAKFPSQNKLRYATTAIQHNASTFVGNVCLPKDLSIVNRRGYASTTRKGVPLVFRCRLDYYLQDTSGVGISAAAGSDFASTLRIEGVQNNWVVRNAAVKWHAAREQMFRDAGVKKSQRGSYSHEIRYNYDGAGETWLSPLDATGTAFTGGTWDPSNLSWTADAQFQLKLVGTGDDEEADAFSGGNVLNMAHSYLLSRMNTPSDTNPEAEEGPAKFSVLNTLLEPAPLSPAGIVDEIVEEARDTQDNPPYEVLDISDSGDTNHDITEPAHLGLAVASLGNGFGSTIIDVPFGIFSMTGRCHDAVGTSVSTTGSVDVTVLDIYEMQG